MKLKFTLVLTSLILIALPPAAGQTVDYQTASQYMQQQEYEKALPILQTLYENNPRSYVYFDRYTECLINLKRFDDAESIARDQAGQNRFNLQASIKLAEILHLKGNRDEALETWQIIVEQNEGSHQAYYATGNSMVNRQEFEAAIELYKEARDTFDDDTLFLNELANTYMQAGLFEESVNEFLRLIILSPDQMSLVQQRFLRMRDETLYEIAAFEIEDKLLTLETSHRAYAPLYQLLVWLLMETDEYQRAFVFARQYENRTSYTAYSLFTLGNQLRSSRQFDLATQAFQYYSDSGDPSVRFRAMEELASAYMEWGQYLRQNNIQSSSEREQRFIQAYQTNEKLIESAPGYDNAERIYSNLIDLSVDFYKDLEKAERWYKEMQQSRVPEDDPYLYYAEGRIALFKQDFITARQALTRADKNTEEAALSEKARYYLSLSDFFAGDFEFAEIQLRTLERRNTSFYANDAIKLRMWIKNGQRADSTGSLLKTIGDALYAIHTGSYENALQQLEPILAASGHSFTDDLTLEISSRLPDQYNSLKLKLLNRVLQSQPRTPLRERLLWDRATLVEASLNKPADSEAEPYTYEFLESETQMEFNKEELAGLYEEILIEFPNGFYASFVREKLESLEKPST